MVSADQSRILVVEDDGAEREGFVELLQLWGYDAQSACDGADALQRLGSSRYDLIVSDLDMPRMSGTELLKELKRRCCSVQCIILSGKENRFEEAMGLGASAFLKKPVSPESLKTAITAGLRQHRPCNPRSAPSADGRSRAYLVSAIRRRILHHLHPFSPNIR